MSADPDELDLGAEVNLLVASPHRYGPGQVHVWDDDEAKTLCGRLMVDCPGDIEWSRQLAHVTCKLCLRSWRATLRREEWQRDEEQRAYQRHRLAERERARREQEDRDFWARYDAYLASPEWAAKRELVLQRANHRCEGCGQRPATIAHHLTYAHVFDELLFELVAVCRPCHDRLHPDRGGPRW